jgi:hypothetical protein
VNPRRSNSSTFDASTETVAPVGLVSFFEAMTIRRRR